MPQPTSYNLPSLQKRITQRNEQELLSKIHDDSNPPLLTISNFKLPVCENDSKIKVNDQRLLQQQRRRQMRQRQQKHLIRQHQQHHLEQRYQEQQKQQQRQQKWLQETDPIQFPEIRESRKAGQKLLSRCNFDSEKEEDNKHLPLSPEDALLLHSDLLTSYEIHEILSYPEIWFVGNPGVKKIQAEAGSSLNDGFDDEQGFYKKVRGDHILYRYELLETLGRGSFGQVVKTFDHKTNQHVALKILRNKRRFLHQTGVEVKLLEDLRDNDKDGGHHVIHMLDSFRFRNHQCVIFELMGPNLYELLKKNKFQGFNLVTIRQYTVSLLRCLRLLNRLHIIHCDLKPENVLVMRNNHSIIKVIDFGSGCYEQNRVYTYIQSRFYRAPEVILGLPYTTAIDMWSLACILVELYTGYPLFPGENEDEQMACIMELIGLPPRSLLEQASRDKVFFDSYGDPKNLTNSKGRKRRPGSRDLKQATKSSDWQFIDFIRKCLVWQPEKRMTPQEALKHDWLKLRKSRMSSTTMLRRSDCHTGHTGSSSSQHLTSHSTSSQAAALELSAALHLSQDKRSTDSCLLGEHVEKHVEKLDINNLHPDQHNGHNGSAYFLPDINHK